MNINDSRNIFWMKRAINLASLGKGLTSPNPLVGAVILDRFGNLISEGFHLKSGEPHAEAMAFNNLQKDSKGGSLFVNLEPCCHQGKTPPCVRKIVSSGIKKVFVSIKDPDQRVAGKGIDYLKKAGISVSLGLCEKESIDLNKAFIHRNITGKCYGVLKWAVSIDGRTSLSNGQSKWITTNSSRSDVHSMRANFDAIIIGGNTLRTDNPLLTTRGLKSEEPIRVVFTKSLNLPEKCNLWDQNTAKTIVAFDGSTANEQNLKRIPADVKTLKLSSDNPSLLLDFLAKEGCNNVLWECGSKLATKAIREDCVQEIMAYISPKILGGKNAMNPLSDLGFKHMDEVISLQNLEFKRFENDFYIRGKIRV